MKKANIFLVASALLIVPSASAQRWFRPSKSEQLKLGQDAAAQIRKESKVLPETDVRSKFVKGVFNDIVSQIPEKDRKEWKFSFDVIESLDVNAFALPGGPMFIYTGLLDRLTTVDSLAGIIGHELTHVTREHWARQTERERNRQAILVGLGSIFRIGRSGMQVADLVTQIRSGLTYSRSNESDADEGGFFLMVGASYNPNSLVEVFELFKKLEGKGGAPAILRSHPVNDDRINHIRDLMKKDGKSYPTEKKLPELPKTPVPAGKSPTNSGSTSGGTSKGR